MAQFDRFEVLGRRIDALDRRREPAEMVPEPVAVDVDTPVPDLSWARRARKDPANWDDDVRCIDLGNAEKVLSDALNGVAWLDDKQHRRILLERMEPDGDARLVVRIAQLASDNAQTSLLAAA